MVSDYMKFRITGSANNWWLRSATASNTTNFENVNNNGNIPNSNNANNANGVCFGFCYRPSK